MIVIINVIALLTLIIALYFVVNNGNKKVEKKSDNLFSVFGVKT